MCSECRGLALLLCVAAAAATATARAQSDAASTPAAAGGALDDGSQSARTDVAPAASAGAAAEDDPRLLRARQIVARGEALFAAGNHDGALAEFSRAHDLLEGHPRQYYVLHNIGLCHERSFRYDLALQFYERYLREAPPDESDRAEVEAVVHTLRGLLATLEIESNVRAEVWIDDRRVAVAPGRVSIPSGRHVVELRAPLHEPARRELDVGARERVRLRFDLPRLSTYSGLPQVYFFTGVGLTAAALAVGTAFAVRAADAHAEGSELGARSLDIEEQRREVDRRALAADISFATAGVLGAASAVLFFLTDWSGAERPPSRGAARARPRVSLAVSREHVSGVVVGAL